MQVWRNQKNIFVHKNLMCDKLLLMQRTEEVYFNLDLTASAIILIPFSI